MKSLKDIKQEHNCPFIHFGYEMALRNLLTELAEQVYSKNPKNTLDIIRESLIDN